MANSRHLKRHSTPKSWGIKRKGITFITKPNPGAHKLEYSIPLVVILRDRLGIVKTLKEAKTLLRSEDILVNGKKVTDVKFSCGLFDILEIKKIGEKKRIVFDEVGVFQLVDAKDDRLYLRISGKSLLKKGKFQLQFLNGYTLLCDEKIFRSAKVNDTAIVSLNDKKIISIVPLKEGSFVYVFDGNYKGKKGEVKSITKYNGLAKDVCEIQIENNINTTAKDYCFAIGTKKEDLEAFN